MGKITRVSIVDRNEIGRENLRRTMVFAGFRSVSTTSDPFDLDDERDQMVVVSHHVASEALAACRIVRRLHVDAHIVVMVDDCCADIVWQALDAGADGVLSKMLPPEPLAASLELIALGERVIPSSLVGTLSSQSPARLPVQSHDVQMDLSRRERAVLERIAAGRANKLISRDLGIAEGTVKVHVKSILRKLGLTNRTQAALWAAERAVAVPPAHEIAAISA